MKDVEKKGSKQRWRDENMESEWRAPKLLKGFKCESQIEDNERVRSRGTLSSSQHFEGVKGHAGAPGWD
jgi:hypothetical protein